MTYDEAKSALYLALEGLRNASPAIVGVLAGADFQQFVCDRTLMPAAAEKNLPFLEFPQVTEWLCARSEEEGRPVIGLNHLMRHVAEDLTNGIRYAPSMIDESLDQAPTTLEELLKLVHFAPRPHLRQQHSSRRLRAVRAMLSNGVGNTPKTSVPAKAVTNTNRIDIPTLIGSLEGVGDRYITFTTRR